MLEPSLLRRTVVPIVSKTAQHSRNVQKHEAPDRRVDRTRKALRDALHALVATKPYDRITLSEILSRADVGRSTFYLHFRDKDDLLASTIVDVMSVAGAPNRAAKFPEAILWFSLPMFEYHAHRRRTPHHGMGERGKTLLHGHLERAICDAIDSQVRREFRDAELIKRFVASSFVLVLNWWLEGNGKIGPAQADATFRAVVSPALIARP